MRIVFDTSMLVAAARSRTGASQALLRALPQPGLTPCLSVALYLEWQDVLTRPEHRPPGQSPKDVLQFLRYLAGLCHHQDIHFLWRPFLTDPGDDMVLELAFAAQAEYIVTHNVRHFAGSEKLGVQAITPGDFHQLLFPKP
ncbi:MAG: PIN domain-containing protein [Verrucomicrobiaceae bacterium]|nr:PIN domain-containing protein [Verrucomicrobiaceae bacterium]